MARIAVGGASLEVGMDGIGSSVVLVHGSASDIRTWKAQRGPFAERYRVIAYSRRFHWPNEPVPQRVDYAMSRQVDDLAALMEKLDAVPAHLVGHSYGAFLCLLLAIRRPDLVRSLVLAEPPAITLFVSSRPRPAEILRLFFTRPRTAAALLRFGVKGVKPATEAFERGDLDSGVRIFGRAVFGPEGFESLPLERMEQVTDNRSSIAAEFLGSGFLPLDDEDVRSLDVPTLLVAGGASIALFAGLLDRLEELLPDSRRVEIPDARHDMHETNPEAFNASVLRFLGTVDADRPRTS